MPGKLKKLSMPKREEISIEELDMPADEMSAEGSSTGMEETDMGEDMGPAAGPLADVSDEELMAEMKKRGLVGELAEGEAGEAETELEDEEDMYA